MTEILDFTHPALAPYQAVNWNKVTEPIDAVVWKTQWTNQWLPEKIQVAKDRPSWMKMSDDEQTTMVRVFVGLNTLDSLQTDQGVPSIARAATTQHEKATDALIGAIEAVHAQSYSYVFMTMCSTTLTEAAYEWADNQPHLQKKIRMIQEAYRDPDPNKSTIASVLLEGFLFYSGFYYPLYLVSRGKMTNTADLIKLIIR